ncbi:NAD-dependent epimerase/dehydratase family protein [Actinomarinicola tropica]|uniref:NAD-dependent epimerase/dehydratase family protein n=1 Tax=Actinomarinicola tropica TaxID=2789776 RepID=UPI001E5894DA|nr:NAD(P)-dependent oxidoreductase [Actinomarinicola tropica]
MLVTGAGGFLGRAVVEAAVAAGHDVVAMIRSASSAQAPDGVEVLRGDLRQRGPWVDALGGVDAVVHLAAAASGDLAEQLAGTVVATENLLSALDLPSLARFVHCSSFSVYDFAALHAGATLDESSPVEPHPERRDAYTATKILQERLVREACDGRTELVVLRPGAIYGPGKDWAHGAALRVGPCALVLGSDAAMRLTYVTNCADALVAALTSPGAAGATIDVVDDEQPTHLEFFRACRSAGATSARPIPVPWRLVDLAGRAVALVDRLAFGGRAKLPELLAHRRQQARWKPLAYSNERARRLLHWVPAVPMEEGVELMVEGRRR